MRSSSTGFRWREGRRARGDHYVGASGFPLHSSWTQMKLPFHLTGLLLVTVACDQDGGRSPGRDSPVLEAVVRDSGQVRIIENPRPPSGSRLGWHIGTEPTVSIGELEGSEPYLLDRVGDALVLPDGRIVVANGGSDELRVFDASGIHVVTWGGRGEGPGEFTNLGQVHRWPGDSLLALYSQARRLTALDPEGNYGRDFALRRGRQFFSVEDVLPGGAVFRRCRSPVPPCRSPIPEHADHLGEERRSIGALGVGLRV